MTIEGGIPAFDIESVGEFTYLVQLDRTRGTLLWDDINNFNLFV